MRSEIDHRISLVVGKSETETLALWADAQSFCTTAAVPNSLHIRTQGNMLKARQGTQLSIMLIEVSKPDTPQQPGPPDMW